MKTIKPKTHNILNTTISITVPLEDFVLVDSIIRQGCLNTGLNPKNVQDMKRGKEIQAALKRFQDSIVIS